MKTSIEKLYKVSKNCINSKVVNCHNCILIVDGECALDYFLDDLNRLNDLEKENEELKEKIRLISSVINPK